MQNTVVKNEFGKICALYTFHFFTNVNLTVIFVTTRFSRLTNYLSESRNSKPISLNMGTKVLSYHLTGTEINASQ
jgi:hypothetical protein